MSGSDWRVTDVGGVVLATCGALADLPNVAHGFSTRRAFGGDGFDLGPAEGGGVEIAWRRRAFLMAVGLGHGTPLILRQVHGRHLVDVVAPAATPPEADGSFRVEARRAETVFPAVRTADCVPLLIADRRTQACAAVHAGWRGTAAGIAEAAIDALKASGSRTEDLVTALGPAIGGCCYEVGAEVVEALGRACPGTSWRQAGGAAGREHVDLHAALRLQLTQAGVPATAIHGAPWCTHCRNDLFFSVRAEGPAAGRLMAVVGPAASA